MTAPFSTSLLWTVGVRPEVVKLLGMVNPDWRNKPYITTEFYLDPIQSYPEEFKFLSASPKTRQKWYITYYLHEIGWYPRTPNNKTSVCVNPMHHPLPKEIANA